MSARDHLCNSENTVRRSDSRRRVRRGALLALLPRLRALPSPLRPTGSAVIFA